MITARPRAGVTGARSLAAGAAVWLAAALIGCGPRTTPTSEARAEGLAAPASANAAATGASGPPVSVTLVGAQQRPFKIGLEANGTVTALSSVDIRSQVASVVTQVHVREGQEVQRGQLLFTLDARADEANLSKAQAQLQRDLAALDDAKRQLERNRDLLARNFIAQGVVDTSATAVAAQEAGVAADRAAIEAARVALSYSRIAAPGAGRIGTIAVYPGSTVSPTTPVLTTLTQIDPIAVAFSLPQRQLPDALAALGNAAAAVTATLPDNRGQRQGKLTFVDNLIDAGSGTVKVKAVFDNRDRALWPGAYVTVSLALRTIADAIVVPQATIVQGARGNAVFVAGKNNVAAIRPVTIIATSGTDAVVKGLAAGERVVLDGRQNVRPGSALAERSPDAAPAARAASAAGSAPANSKGAVAAQGPPA